MAGTHSYHGSSAATTTHLAELITMAASLEADAEMARNGGWAGLAAECARRADALRWALAEIDGLRKANALLLAGKADLMYELKKEKRKVKP